MTPDPKAVEALAEALRSLYRLDHPHALMDDWRSDANHILDHLDPRDLLSPEDRAALRDGLALASPAGDIHVHGSAAGGWWTFAWTEAGEMRTGTGHTIADAVIASEEPTDD